MKLFDIGKSLIKEIKKQGHQAYFVGGAVRDLILKRSVHDIDIATSALPEEVSRIFKKVVPTGLKHGTVTVVVDDIPFEITTYRKEGKYTDFRHPDQVFFVNNLEEDLARRDFTMNAMAMDENDHILDPFCGQADISQTLIRTVGNANDRFLEDPLRMLRAVRFAAQLNFTIEKQTWDAMKEHASFVQNIAIERIKQELDKILAAAAPDLGIQLLYKSQLIYWIKGLNIPSLLQSDFYEIGKQMKQSKISFIRWSIWLNGLDTKEREVAMQQLKMSKKESLQIRNILQISHSLRSLIHNGHSLKKCLLQSNVTDCLYAIELNAILGYIDDSEHMAIKDQIILLNKELPVRKTSELAISGKELSDFFQRAPGPWIKEMLDLLLEKVVFHQLINEPKELILAAKRIKGEKNVEGQN